MAIPID